MSRFITDIHENNSFILFSRQFQLQFQLRKDNGYYRDLTDRWSMGWKAVHRIHCTYYFTFNYLSAVLWLLQFVQFTCSWVVVWRDSNDAVLVLDMCQNLLMEENSCLERCCEKCLKMKELEENCGFFQLVNRIGDEKDHARTRSKCLPSAHW